MDNGADPNVRNKRCESVVYGVASSEALKLLISRGANLNVANKSGQTPLFHCLSATPVLVELLLDHGACVDAQNTYYVCGRSAAGAYRQKRNASCRCRSARPLGANHNRSVPTRRRTRENLGLWLAVFSESERLRGSAKPSCPPSERKRRFTSPSHARHH